tara:strand:+ start:2520 stop:2975 length:456 start_codon:yes stop_codon:yes gene_type:complete
MSTREDIAKDIIVDLKGITNPGVVVVSRNPININELAITQFPAIVVRTAEEIREDATMQTDTLRFGTINYQIECYVRADSSAKTVNNSIDTQINVIVEAVEEALETDRKRNSKALNSFVSAVTQNNEGVQFPIGRVDITFTVQYKYTRGTL